MKTILLCGLLGFACAAFAEVAVKPLYENSFEQAEADKVPDDLMVLGGEFVVKVDGTNNVLELPGAPLDSFAVQFGPAEKENVAVSARILGTSKGRRAPTFGVGLGGVSGWKLQVSPGKKALELMRDAEVKATMAFDWKSGEWTQLRLQIRAIKSGEWKIEGKAWQAGSEPKEWTISADEKEEPVSGKASVLGSPFAGTPIWFDGLRVDQVGAK
jgi:predicted secreted protein